MVGGRRLLAGGARRVAATRRSTNPADVGAVALSRSGPACPPFTDLYTAADTRAPPSLPHFPSCRSAPTVDHCLMCAPACCSPPAPLCRSTVQACPPPFPGSPFPPAFLTPSCFPLEDVSRLQAVIPIPTPLPLAARNPSRPGTGTLLWCTRRGPPTHPQSAQKVAVLPRLLPLSS